MTDSSTNVFDQFDAPAPAQAQRGNVFDQFDAHEPPAAPQKSSTGTRPDFTNVQRRSTTPPPSPPAPNLMGPMAADAAAVRGLSASDPAKAGIAKAILGAEDVGATVASRYTPAGLLPLVAGGIAGLGSAATGGDAAQTTQKVAQTLSYEPSTAAGKVVAAPMDYVVGKLAEGGGYLGQKTLDVTGSPALATAVDTATQTLPLLLGERAVRGGVNAAKAVRAADLSRGDPAVDTGMVRDLQGTPAREQTSPPSPTSIDTTPNAAGFNAPADSKVYQPGFESYRQETIASPPSANPYTAPVEAEIAAGRTPGPIASALANHPAPTAMEIAFRTAQDNRKPPPPPPGAPPLIDADKVAAQNPAPVDAIAPPQGQVNELRDVDEPQGYFNPFDAFDRPSDAQPLAEPSTPAPNFFDRFDIPDEPPRATDTSTPEFQQFFDGSHVAHDDGSPMVVHHGTAEDFNIFDSGKLGDSTGHMTTPLGHFLTEDRTEAQRYAEKAANGVPADERVIDAYASIKNPAPMDKETFLSIDSQDQARALRQWLEQQGYDGIRLDLGNDKTQWFAFDSGQIKDINNRGTWDSSNPDIRYARAGDNSVPGLGSEEVNEVARRVLRVNPEDAGVRVVDSFEKLPDAPRKMAEAEGVRDGDIRALHVNGQSWLLADQMRNPADVQEAIFHEHYTHGGLRAKFGRELGPKLDELLTGVGGEDGVRRLAGKQGIDLSAYDKAIADNPRIGAQDKQRVLMEELLAHISKLTGTLKRTVQEWVGAVRDWLRRNGFAKLAEYGETDLAHVLKQARQAAIEKARTPSGAGPFYMRTPADRTQSGTAQDRMSFERPTEDELHEAHSLAKNAVLRRAFGITQEGKENVVRYNGKEVARIVGTVNRTNLTKAIAEQIKPAEAKAREQTQTTAPLSDLPARRAGEERGAWLRRLSTSAAGEDVKRATALRAQQKIVGRHAIREMLAGRARALDTADAIFGEYRKLFDKTEPVQNFANVDAFETGKPIPDADFRAFLAQMKPGFVQRINRLRELNPNALKQLVAHYMPHMYDDPQRAQQVLSSFMQRNSVAGDKGFLKQREWPTLKQAMDAGLRPITNNPVDWVLLRYASMDKYIGALELRQELQARGWLHKVKDSEQIPPGYTRVTDPTFNGYAVPANFARDLTNYLDPGFSKYAAWRTLRGAQNFMVAADLGFSGFHAVFTSTDNIIMHMDVAARRAAIGDSRGAAATLVKALTSVATSPFEGHKLNQQWRGIRSADANTAAILDALERGGARWKMSTTEYQNAIPKVARMFRQMLGDGIRAHTQGKTPAELVVGAIKVPGTALQAVAEMGSYLIHHVLVPNQKMAARVLLYKYELDRRAHNLGRSRGDYAGIIDAMHPDVVRQIAAQVNDVVDYRLGQMTYDNRFWNRTVQDVAQAAVMAPGWQYGMLQTVLGAGKAVKDIVSPSRLVAPLDRGGMIADAHMGRMGSNLSYFITLALTLGGGMAALQYLLTGKGPDGIKDYFFPKTGRKNDDDSDERLQLPNYWVDHYKLTTEPVHTGENKIHPLWKMLWELGHNKDYFGTQIRNPDAPTLEQAKQVGEYMVSKFVPITVGNIRKGMARDESTAQHVGHFFGINNAPVGVARSTFQNFVMQGGTKGWGDYTKTQDEAERRQDVRAAAAAIRRGDEPDLDSLAPDERAKARKDAQQPVPALLFKKLSDIDKLRAWDIATPEERERYGLRTTVGRMHLERSAPFKRLPPDQQTKYRQQLQSIRGGGQGGNVFDQFGSE